MSGALSDGDRDKLAKICGLLSSSVAGERSAAAYKASAFLKKRGLTWRDVLSPPAAPVQFRSAAEPSAFQQVIELLQLEDSGALNAWELRFLRDLRRLLKAGVPLSAKQRDKLSVIWETVGPLTRGAT